MSTIKVITMKGSKIAKMVSEEKDTKNGVKTFREFRTAEGIYGNFWGDPEPEKLYEFALDGNLLRCINGERKVTANEGVVIKAESIKDATVDEKRSALVALLKGKPTKGKAAPKPADDEDDD